MTMRYRNRYSAIIRPDIRQLRHALCMTVAEAAVLLGEPDSLLYDQEQAGLGADHGFVTDCLHTYVFDAATRSQNNSLPPMSDSTGTPTVYWLRIGLGLEPRDSEGILRQSPAYVQHLENGKHPLPDGLRAEAWCTYVDWANRRLRRHERYTTTRPTMSPPLKRARTALGPTEVAQIQMLAYVPPLSPEQAEAKARRLLAETATPSSNYPAAGLRPLLANQLVAIDGEDDLRFYVRADLDSSQINAIADLPDLVRAHGPAFRAFLQLPDVDAGAGKLEATFHEVYIGEYADMEDIARDLIEFDEFERDLEELTAKYGVDSFITIDHQGLERVLRASWDIVELDGNLYVFTH